MSASSMPATPVGATAAPSFQSRRSPVASKHGIVCCTQPAACEAGLHILRSGGNAVDAAVAVAAAMAVCEPCSTGMGGDAFALVYDAASLKVQGMNASGRCPQSMTLATAREVAQDARSPGSMQPRHAATVTVPGAPAGWVDAHARWGSGRFTLGQLLAPAIALAEDGFPVAPLTAHHWGEGEHILRAAAAGGVSGNHLLPNGRAPEAGEVFVNPGMAASLRALATGGTAGFYTGRIARAIVDAVQSRGGMLSMDDLASHTSTFDDPICVDYAGARVWEMPPNGQGLAALLALNVLRALPDSYHAAAADAQPVTGRAYIPSFAHAVAQARGAHGGCNLADVYTHNSAAYLHTLIEAMRLAFADTRYYAADPAHAHVPVAELLSDAYARTRAAGMSPRSASRDVREGAPVTCSDTVSFQVVDGDGNACSFINSNYMGFGTGIVPEGCGFSLQNRGAGFSLEAGHANSLAPSKRPYHTIIPAMATWADDGSLLASFSVMGGFMQPQGHVQTLLNMLVFGMDPQTALDMPRFCIMDGTAGGEVALEDGIHPDDAAQLQAWGHHLHVADAHAHGGLRYLTRGHARALFGRGQMIVRHRDTGVMWAGSDGRGDGVAGAVHFRAVSREDNVETPVRL